MPRKQTVDVPAAATKKLQLVSLDDYVDQMMERLGGHKIDLQDEHQRERFRAFLHEELTGFVSELACDVSKGADRGIRQVLELVRDPDYYRLAAERRRQRKSWWKDSQSDEPIVLPEPAPEFMTDKGIELAQLQVGIYHVDTLAEPGWQRSLIGEAMTVEAAEIWIRERFGAQSRDEQLRRDGSNSVEIVQMQDRRIVARHAVARGWKWTP